MRVVGTTTEHEALLVSRQRPFRINEILIIQDTRGDVRAEVIRTQSLNPLLPESNYGTGLLDDTTLSTLRAMGFVPEEETLYIAQVRVLSELDTPITVGAQARVPDFGEIQDILVPSDVSKSLLMGVIRGTEELYKTLPDSLKDLEYTVDPKSGELLPQNGVPFFFDVEKMEQYPHIGIFGGSGSGKSYAMRVLIEELMAKRLPVLVFDPHYELDFSQPIFGVDPEMCYALKDQFVLLELGTDVGIRFDSLTEAELMVLLKSSMGEFTENMEHAARRLYRKGDSLQSYRQRIEDVMWILSHKKEVEELVKVNPEPDTREARLVELYSQYSQAQLSEYSLSAVVRRVDALEMSGLFKKDSEAIEQGLKSGKTVVVRGPIRNLNIYAVYVIRHFYNKRRAYRDAVTHTGRATEEFFPPFFIVTDEAHNLVPKATGLNDYAPARPIFREIAQEGRKYGVFLVLATQRPALLDDTVNAQLNTKFILRTVRAQDIDTIQRETDLAPSETARLPYLTSGNAFVSSAITGRTVPVRIRASWTSSPHAQSPFEEWRAYVGSKGEDLYPVVQELLPFNTMQLAAVAEKCAEKLGRAVSVEELKEALERWLEQGRIKSSIGRMGNMRVYTAR
ncbi:ATP-binding protein [Caldanaerobius polysaccharolyticus]|uniref:ATP-binding protein n=1 Tax=Caldanaerobius polysaccharolyticus TaxID=44256 RepID=UPI00047B2EA7|nr:ATP-binding protein [Caldanaerobius polysaccharolyticus]